MKLNKALRFQTWTAIPLRTPTENQLSQNPAITHQILSASRNTRKTLIHGMSKTQINLRKKGFTTSGTHQLRCEICGKSFVLGKDSPLGTPHAPIDNAISVIQRLLEGCSVPKTQRITGEYRDGILALLGNIGSKCKQMTER